MVPSVICAFATLIHMTSVSLVLACGGGVSAWSSVPGPGCSEGVLLGFMKSERLGLVLWAVVCHLPRDAGRRCVLG